MIKRRIEAEWIVWRDSVDLTNAPADQIREMRRAFYGGVMALSFLVNRILDDTQDVTEADETRIEELLQEMMDFMDDVKGGRA